MLNSFLVENYFLLKVSLVITECHEICKAMNYKMLELRSSVSGACML